MIKSHINSNVHTSETPTHYYLMGRLVVSWATDLCNGNERRDCKHPMQQYILHLLHLLDLPDTQYRGPWCGFCKLHNYQPQYPTPKGLQHSTSWFRNVWLSWWKRLVRLESWNPRQRARESYLCLLKPLSAITKSNSNKPWQQWRQQMISLRDQGSEEYCDRTEGPLFKPSPRPSNLSLSAPMNIAIKTNSRWTKGPLF